MSYTEKTRRLGEAAKSMLDFVEEADRVLRLSMSGIRMVQAVPQAVKAISQVNGDKETAEHEKRLKSAEQSAAFAKEQVAGGFPLLYAHATVAIWSALEATVPKMAVFWLCDYPDAATGLPDSSIKLPLKSLVGSPEMVMGHVVDSMLAISIGDGRGIGKFEGMLDKIGLGGPFSDVDRKSLFELSQVRNLIVHQFSVVDAKFLKSCPWINVRTGEQLKISNEDYCRYRDAAVKYLTEIIIRALAVAQKLSREAVESDLARKQEIRRSKKNGERAIQKRNTRSRRRG